MALTLTEKSEIVKNFGDHPNDCGKTEVQVGLLTQNIKNLTAHLETNKKDHRTRLALLKMVGQRRRLLNYLIKNDIERYRKIISELGLRR